MSRAFEIDTERLVLRPITEDDVAAVLGDQRLPEWASDFPDEGDRVIAGLLAKLGTARGDARAFGHRLVVERSTGAVVGGVGFFGPPSEGRLEIGYGVVPSRQGRGYATEATLALLEDGFTRPGVTEILASTVPGNRPSVRVLEKAGFELFARDEKLLHFRWPGPG